MDISPDDLCSYSQNKGLMTNHNLNLNSGSIQFDQYDLGANESLSETLLPHLAPENNSVF